MLENTETCRYQFIIYPAANGHFSLEFGSYDSLLWQKISRYLETDLGFVRVGDVVVGLDEGIRQSFLREGLLIQAGWDNWSGDYLLSDSASGDELLQSLFEIFEAGL